jgi:hypothetical protein
MYCIWPAPSLVSMLSLTLTLYILTFQSTLECVRRKTFSYYRSSYSNSECAALFNIWKTVGSLSCWVTKGYMFGHKFVVYCLLSYAVENGSVDIGKILEFHINWSRHATDLVWIASSVYKRRHLEMCKEKEASFTALNSSLQIHTVMLCLGHLCFPHLHFHIFWIIFFSPRNKSLKIYY